MILPKLLFFTDNLPSKRLTCPCRHEPYVQSAPILIKSPFPFLLHSAFAAQYCSELNLLSFQFQKTWRRTNRLLYLSSSNTSTHRIAVTLRKPNGEKRAAHFGHYTEWIVAHIKCISTGFKGSHRTAPFQHNGKMDHSWWQLKSVRWENPSSQ